MLLKELRKGLDSCLLDYGHAKQSVSEERKILTEAESYSKAVSEAQILVQSAAESIQNIAHQRIASVVTKCLRTVFGEEYEFKINFVKRRSRTEAELVFVKDGMEIDPLMASGGGVVDVASMALRLSCLMLVQPPRRRLLILDEPFKYLSSRYRLIARDLLQELSYRMGIQMIIVTHMKEFFAGKVIEIGQEH